MVDNPTTDREKAFAEHTDQIANLRSFASLLGEKSGLLLDPEGKTFFLMDIVVERFIPWIEIAGVMRGAGAGLLSRADATQLQGVSLLALSKQLDGQTRVIQEKLDALKRAGESSPVEWDAAVLASNAFTAEVNKAFGNGVPKGDSASFFALGTQAIEADRAFQKVVSDRADCAVGTKKGTCRAIANRQFRYCRDWDPLHGLCTGVFQHWNLAQYPRTAHSHDAWYTRQPCSYGHHARE